MLALLPQQPSVYLYNYILLPYNHAATPTTLTTTYCYPTTMLLPQQPSLYPYNYILLPHQVPTLTTTYCYPTTMLLPQLTLTTTYCYPTTMLLPQEPSLPLQLHTATLQPCCYPNNLVPTLTTTYCYPATMLLPQQPSPYPYNYILLPCNHAATPTT